MPTNNSMMSNEAFGKCDNCGNVVSFGSNENTAQCTVCLRGVTRSASGAADNYAIRGGFKIGEGVRPLRQS